MALKDMKSDLSKFRVPKVTPLESKPKVQVNKNLNKIIDEKAEEFSDKNEQVALLYRCISKLEENERIIITLVLDEVPYAEIAEISGISEGNLRVKIHRIKQKLTELYSRYERI